VQTFIWPQFTPVFCSYTKTKS